MRRKIMMKCLVVSVVLLTLLLPFRVRASTLDLGIEAGVIKRSLSDTDYKTGFVWQLNAELGVLPVLMLGPYATFAQSTPDIPVDNPTAISFRTIGLRAKLKLPLPGQVKPYGVAGIGWAHGNFPDQVLKVCVNGACAQRSVPSATADFAEFLLGGGLMWEAAKPLAFTLEFNWRPTTGYKNDTYEKQIQSGQTQAPDPSRNGVAWVGLLGVALTF